MPFHLISGESDSETSMNWARLAKWERPSAFGTPAVLLPMIRGQSMPHMTPDIVEKLQDFNLKDPKKKSLDKKEHGEKLLGCTSYEHLFEEEIILGQVKKENTTENDSNLVGTTLPCYAMADEDQAPVHWQLWSFRDLLKTLPSKPLGHGDKFVNLETSFGRQKIDWARFQNALDRQLLPIAGKPSSGISTTQHILTSMVDACYENPLGNKRAKKSVDRTLGFLDLLLKWRLEQRRAANIQIFGVIAGGTVIPELKRCMEETVKHESIDGFVMDWQMILANASQEQQQEIFQMTNDILPADKPRVMLGTSSLKQIFDSIKGGFDFVDATLAYQLTERGEALRPGNPLMDLKDERYARDFNPIDDSCGCFACAKHTRAYIHHLLNVKEILASTLLMSHNTFQLLKVVSCVREAIKDGDLAQLEKKMIEVQ